MKEYMQQHNKGYRDLNQEKIKQISKDYLERKKAELSEKRMCECGKIYTVPHFKRHEKSPKHRKFLKQKSDIDEQQLIIWYNRLNDFLGKVLKEILTYFN